MENKFLIDGELIFGNPKIKNGSLIKIGKN